MARKLKTSAINAVPYLNEYINKTKKKENEDISPVKTTGVSSKTGKSGKSDIAPFVMESENDNISSGERKLKDSAIDSVPNLREQLNQQNERKWFEKGLYKDGYQRGDFVNTAFSSLVDADTNIVAGAIGLGEKALDTLVTIAPYTTFFGGEYRDLLKKAASDFVAKDLYDENAVAKSILEQNNPFISLYNKSFGLNTEEASVFGAKSDDLFKSAGELAATAGLSAIGVPWFVTTGVSSFGGESENAVKQGATLDKAVVSGLVSAGAEILTEKLSGGIKFGGKALDDVLVDRLSRGVSNKLVRALLKTGMDVGVEGFEEVLSGAISSFGQWLTYRNDEELKDILFSEEAIDEYIESFIGGAVLGGGSSVSNSVISAAKGVDPVSGLNKQEQTIVNKVFEQYAEEAAKEKGKKLTAKEKDKIYSDVVEMMDKGRISIDTIEEFLGGDSYKAYKEAVDSEDAIRKEYEELGNKTNATLAEQSRYNELGQKIKDFESNSKSSELKSKLSNDVYDLVKDSRLSESYREDARRYIKFEADLTKYDEKHRQTIQNAIDSGILNNTNKTHEFVDLIAKITADKDVSFDFTNNKKLKESGFAVENATVNGYVTKDGVTINVQSKKALNFVVGHEITHVLEGTELYKKLRKTLFEYAKIKGEYDSRRSAVTELYKNVKDADIDSELTADLVGDYIFSDTDFIRKLSVENRNIFQKIFDEIKHLCKLATAGSQEARQLEQVRKAFEDAYRESGKKTDVKSDDVYAADTKYSLIGTNKNGIEVYETSKSIMDLSWKERKAKYLDVMKNQYRGRTARFERNGHVYYAEFDLNSIRKPIYGDSRSSANGVKALIKTGADGDVFDLVENSKYTGSAANTKDHTDADYFDYFVKTVQIDGKVFDLVADVEKKQGVDGGYVYTLALIDNNKIKASPAHETTNVDSVNSAGNASVDNVAQIDADVKRSTSKADGNQYIQYSLESVDPVQPKNDKWSRTHTTEEAMAVFPDMWNIAADESESRNPTQITSTVNTYRKIYDILQSEGFNGTILDASSGLGYGTRAGIEEYGFDVEDIEPFPDKGYDPMYRDYSALDKKYDAIISNAVLNVLPQDQRDALVAKMGEMLNVGGRLFVNVRGKDVETLAKTGRNIHLGNMEWIETTKGSYQKGFTRSELIAYLQDALGDGFTVKPSNAFGGVSAIVTKEAIAAPTEELIKSGGASWRGMPIQYDANLKSEASNFSTLMKVGDKFFDLDEQSQIHVLNHEVAHNIADRIMKEAVSNWGYAVDLFAPEKRLPDSAKDRTFPFNVRTDENGNRWYREGLYGDLGATAFSETLTNAVLEYFDNPDRLKQRSEGAYEYIDSYLKSSGDNLDNASGRFAYSLSSIANSFFGNENMSSSEFALSDYRDTQGYKDYVDQCLNNLSQTRKDFDAETARKDIEDSIDGIVRVAIAAKQAGYDILDDRTKRNTKDSKKRLLFSSLEPNSDYFTSSDISTICDKRQNFAEIYDDIVRAEEAKGVPVGKRFFDNVDNYFAIHKIMADKGLTQPCRQCYVESMRKNLTPMATAFLRLINETDVNNTANDQLYNTKGKNKGQIKANNAQTREWVLNALSEYGMGTGDITIETLTTADGLAQLKICAPKIYEAFNSFYGQSKPKMPKGATPFRFGELTALLTDEKGNIVRSRVDKINSTGGFRLQSYSDFQIQNFVDVLQVIFEAGTLGLNGHAYTKVPAFLDATEGTNLKRNISIFMYKDGDEWKLDKNDSFPYDLDEIYDIVRNDETGNTGIIAVSQNADMSAWIMANDMVGYGIPFHKSGLKMNTVRSTIVNDGDREINGYAGIKDHTKQQSEVWAKSSEDHKALTKVKNGINIYSFWDFDNKSNLTKNELIEKNVKAYIDACELAGYLPKFREYVMNNGDVLNNVLKYAKRLGYVSQDATIADISFEYKGYTIPYGYYKFLGDFGMFKPDGTASSQEVLSLKSYDFDKAVEYFADAKTLRRNEILQQFSNGEERQRYRDSDMDAEELGEIVKSKRGEVVNEVLNRKNSLSADDESAIAPIGTNNVYGEDIALAERAEDIVNRGLESVEQGDFDQVAILAEELDEINEMERYIDENGDDIAPPVPPQENTPSSNDGATKSSKHTVKRKNKLWSWIKEHLVDNGMVFEDVSRQTGNDEVQAKWNYIRYAEARAQRFIGNGDGDVKSLKSIKETVEKSGKLQDFIDYMTYRHTADRMSLRSRFGIPDKAVLKHENGDVVTADEANTIANALESMNPEFTEWANDVYDFIRYTRNMLVDGGLISAETANLWERMYPHYIPIDRNFLSESEYVAPLEDSNRTGVSNPVKAATGSTREIMPLFSTIADRTVNIYKAVSKNSFGLELKNTLDTVIENATVNNDSNESSRVIPNGTRVRASDRNNIGTIVGYNEQTGQYDVYFKNNSGREATVRLDGNSVTPLNIEKQGIEGVNDVIDSFGVDQDFLLNLRNGGTLPTFTVYENGKSVEFAITDEMYNALKPRSEFIEEAEDLLPLKTLRKASSLHRKVLTEFSIPFIVKNAIKDAQSVVMNSKHPIMTYLRMPQSALQMLTNGKWFNEYLNNGGEQNSYFDRESREFEAESKFKKAVGIPFKGISAAGNFVERIPRLAEYIESRSRGNSVEKSMLDAARVTTNFAAGGDVTKFLNRNGATFLNASVQGFVQQVRNVKEAKANGFKGVMGLVARYAAAGLPVLLFNHLLWDDDDEYEELSDYVKQNYYVIAKYGDGKFVRIPKGREVAVIQFATQMLSDLITGDDNVDLGRLTEFGQFAFENIAPNNPLEDNVIAPVIQTINNKTWYGDDLVPSRLQDVPASEQFDETTDDISRQLGEWLNISPYKINYLLNQYTGGLGDLVLPMMTPKAETGDDSVLGKLTAPMRDVFTTDSVLKNRNVSDFYSLRDAATITANGRNATEEDAIRKRYLDTVNSDMSALYRQKREVQNSNLPDSEKYNKVRAIQARINSLAEGALNGYNDVTVDGLYAQVGDRRYNRSDANGEWREITPINSDGKANSYYQQEQNIIRKFGITPSEYWNNREEYDFAYEKPEQYLVSKTVGGYEDYKRYTSDLWNIKADKDENGKSIAYSRKNKVLEYINGMDADYGTKLILFKNEYNADDTYNLEIIEYLNSRDDISYSDMETILKYLGFKVDSDGNISW